MNRLPTFVDFGLANGTVVVDILFRNEPDEEEDEDNDEVHEDEDDDDDGNSDGYSE